MDYDYFDNVIDYDYDYIDFSSNVIVDYDYVIVIVIMSTITITDYNYPMSAPVQLSGNDLNDLVSSLNAELQLVCTWLQANKLSLNAQKNLFSCLSQGKSQRSQHEYPYGWLCS